MGRPNEQDLKKVLDFGAEIIKRLQDAKNLNDIPAVIVPGTRPYRDELRRSRLGMLGSEPAALITREELCTKCGICAEVCPNAAITLGSAVETRKEACIRCYACIKNCATNARVRVNPFFAKEAKWLHDTFPDRKEPKTYM